MFVFRLVADTGKCLIGSSTLYDEKKTVTDIVKNLCDNLVLDLKTKSCVDPNTMDNVRKFLISTNRNDLILLT